MWENWQARWRAAWQELKSENGLLSWLKSLDQILRGEVTQPAQLQPEQGLSIPLRGLSILSVLLAMSYGACMGTFALFRGAEGAQVGSLDRYWQVLATTIKVPALFFLTLAITFPSLYVFNALVGSRLSLLPMLRLLVASLGVNLAVLASLGPIVAFFSVSTTSYDFMLLFNVVMFAVAGTFGLLFLMQTLNRMSQLGVRPSAVRVPPSSEYRSADEAPLVEPLGSTGAIFTAEAGEAWGSPGARPLSAIDRVDGQTFGKHVRMIFCCWLVVYGLVGAQMGWVLRPFLGDPQMAFTWFRSRESNFFQNVFEAFLRLLGASS